MAANGRNKGLVLHVRIVCGSLSLKNTSVTSGVDVRILTGQRYKICDVMSWGSHSRLLERAIINVQALGGRTKLSVLYPYSTQATNRPNRHELVFFLFGGIREVSLFFFSNRDELRVIPDSDTMSLRIFG